MYIYISGMYMYIYLYISISAVVQWQMHSKGQKDEFLFFHFHVIVTPPHGQLHAALGGILNILNFYRIFLFFFLFCCCCKLLLFLNEHQLVACVSLFFDISRKLCVCVLCVFWFVLSFKSHIICAVSRLSWFCLFVVIFDFLALI